LESLDGRLARRKDPLDGLPYWPTLAAEPPLLLAADARPHRVPVVAASSPVTINGTEHEALGAAELYRLSIRVGIRRATTNAVSIRVGAHEPLAVACRIARMVHARIATLGGDDAVHTILVGRAHGARVGDADARRVVAATSIENEDAWRSRRRRHRRWR